MANSESDQVTDTLNSIGAFILDIDARLIGLAAILLAGVAFIYDLLTLLAQNASMAICNCPSNKDYTII